MWSGISYFSLAVLLVFLCDRTSAENSEPPSQFRANVTNVVLIGATGDLAKRYLWRGFFTLYTQEEKEGNSLRFYAAARDDFDSGRKKIDAFLKDSMKCSDVEIGTDACLKMKEDFASVTQYHRLKSDDDYKSLCQEITNNIGPGVKEQGRIFYLSVPPFAYGEIAKRIDSFCRPQDTQAWVRVVFEKPFGSDITSALELSATLSKYFDEKEIYRIDHYLGKTGVAQILDFRVNNNNLYKELWNGDHIERVEIALKETGDCQGRTNFYDKYGVIRDVMQNHMTELLVMVAMEIPNSLDNTTSILQNKLRLLKEIKPTNKWSAVIGQYNDYNKHYQEENGDQEGRTDSTSSTTPTFAAVSMFVNNPRWRGVPFVLVSGKQLDERAASVRVIFKNNVYNVHSGLVSQDQCCIKQIVFNIQGGRIDKPAILISGPLPKPTGFIGLAPDKNNAAKMFGCLENDFHAFIHDVSSDAYTALISAVYHEQKNLFVGTEDLIASWEVWSPLLKSLNSVVPRPYDRETTDMLEFVTLGERLEFTQTDRQGNCDSMGDCESETKTTDHYKPVVFRKNPLVTGQESHVVRSLADHIIQHALKAVSLKGVFHLALSGGTSPIMLYETLAFSAMEFPWQHTHIWIVDERCFPLDSKQSNFHLVYTTLLQHVPVSPFNVHPYFVSLKGGLCNPEDYEAELRRTLGEDSLDFVVLGVGADGHTASLFPRQLILNNETEKWISLSESSHDSEMKERMTMTFSLLNEAKVVSVLVLGEQKRDIVSKISGGETDVWRYPITGVQPEKGELLWYMDNKALYGSKDTAGKN